ncbi:MAG: DivIVA domain-containing protein [Knoellia sp.]
MDPTTLAETLRSAAFAPTQFRAGYDEGAVDQLLDELEAAVQAGSSGAEVADIASSAALPMTSMRRGYDCGDVDDFLDEVVRQSSVPATTGQMSTGQEPKGQVPTQPRMFAPAEASVPASPQRRGLGTRLLGLMRGE